MAGNAKSASDLRRDVCSRQNVNLDWLRIRRKERGMTMKQVADAAGLTVGFISQIERGLTSPSLSSLVAVANALGVSISEVLDQPGADQPQTRSDHRPVYAISANSVRYERISSAFPGKILNSVIAHEPPGNRAAPISHFGEEILYVLDGAITVEVSGKQTVLYQGDSIHFPSKLTHSTWNHAKVTATILWVGTMDIFGEDTEQPSDA